MRPQISTILDYSPFGQIMDLIDPHRPRFDIGHTKRSIGHRLVNTFILHLKSKEAFESKSKIKMDQNEWHKSFGLEDIFEELLTPGSGSNLPILSKEKWQSK